MSAVPKPLPRPQGLNADWYRELAAGRLCFQRCDDCGVWRHPPRFRCAGCGSDRWSWHASSGRGVLYSWTVIHRPHPAFADEAPYAVAVVELEEGPRLVARLRDVAPGELALDLPLVLEIEKIDDAIALPWFRRA